MGIFWYLIRVELLRYEMSLFSGAQTVALVLNRDECLLPAYLAANEINKLLSESTSLHPACLLVMIESGKLQLVALCLFCLFELVIPWNIQSVFINISSSCSQSIVAFR